MKVTHLKPWVQIDCDGFRVVGHAGNRDNEFDTVVIPAVDGSYIQLNGRFNVIEAEGLDDALQVHWLKSVVLQNKRRSFMESMKNWKTQVTAILTALFAVVNAFYPELMEADVENQIICGLVAMIGVFATLKVNRVAAKNKGGDK